jgi:hypothetical protein
LLQNQLLEFEGDILRNIASLKWKVSNNPSLKYFDVERSIDGLNFAFISRVVNNGSEGPEASYTSSDPLYDITAEKIYYRIKLTDMQGKISYSRTIRLNYVRDKKTVTIMPNPVRDWAQLNISTTVNKSVSIYLYNYLGERVYTQNAFVERGENVITLTEIAKCQKGVYQLVVKFGSEIYFEKIIILK